MRVDRRRWIDVRRMLELRARGVLLKQIAYELCPSRPFSHCSVRVAMMRARRRGLVRKESST